MKKNDGISESDFYDFLESGWKLSDLQLSSAISFLQDIQQRRSTYGNPQEMALFFAGGGDPKCPEGHPLVCCGHTRSGSQRYLCRTCGKTYTHPARTVLDTTKLSSLTWRQLVQLASGRMTIRRLATLASVNKNTAWYFRMRLMSAMSGVQDGVVLEGHVWIDELYKTSRKTDEKKKRGISRQLIPVYVACDSLGHVLFRKGGGRGKPTLADATESVDRHIGPGATIVTTDGNSCYGFLEGRTFKHETVLADPSSKEYHRRMEPVNDLCSSLRKELERHNGIVAANLQRYLDLFYLEYVFEHQGIDVQRAAHALTKLAISGKAIRRKDFWNGQKRKGDGAGRKKERAKEKEWNGIDRSKIVP